MISHQVICKLTTIQQINQVLERKIEISSSSSRSDMMKYSTSFRFSSLLFFFVLFVAVAFAADGDSRVGAGAGSGECEYSLNVQTGTVDSAGTDAIIRVTLGDASGETVHIPNLQEWGVMGSGHNYFENGDLDIFTLRAPCIPTPLCSIVVSSDNSGAKPGWYLEYMEVTTTGPRTPPSGQTTIFDFNQWLAVDSPPYQLTATRDTCEN